MTSMKSATSIKSTKSFVLAFDFGGTKMAIAVATLDREIIARNELSTIEFNDGATALNRTILASQALVKQTQMKLGGELVGVGVATMGITFPDRVAMSPNVPGWEDLKIGSSMQSAFPGVPIHIDNDVKAAALAEVRRGALYGKDYGIYVNMGTGISIALTLGNRVLQGHNGASGEVAYLMRTKDELLGIRDGVAPFEEHSGGKAIGERASEHFGVTLTAKDLFTRAATDESVSRFIEKTLEEIAFQLTNVIITWDPEIVVFGGGMAAGNEMFLPYIQRRVERFVPFPPVLALAHFERDAGLYGAIELAL